MGGDKPKKIKAFLGSLPEKIARQLTMAVEHDRVSGGKELPHELLLDGLRPTITTIEDRVNRTPTPMRLFCMPFEDLLVVKRREKRPGRIARSTLVPMWDLLASDFMPALFREHYDALTIAILTNDLEQTEQISGEMHAAGAAAIQRALEGAPVESTRRAELAKLLGGEAGVEDLADIAKVLESAPEVMDLREVFPERVKSLTPELMEELRTQYDLVAQHMPDSAPYIVAVAMSRLTKPWEILRVGKALSKRDDDSLLARTDLSIIGDLLFGDIEDCATYFGDQDSHSFDPEEMLYQLTKFARLSEGMANELNIQRESPWGKKLNGLKKSASSILERLLERVPEQITEAMPFRASGSFAARTSRRPDLRGDPDPKILNRAIELATFMRETRPIATYAAVAASHSDAYDTILDNLNRYRDGLLSELRSFDDHEMLSRARAFLDLTVELTAILVSEGEAQIYRRKGALAERGDQVASG